jgi:hypothetical protein
MDHKISQQQPAHIPTQTVRIELSNDLTANSRTVGHPSDPRKPGRRKEDLTANDRVRIFQNGGPCLPPSPPEKATPTSGFIKAWLDAGCGEANYAVQLSKLDTRDDKK